MSTVKKIREIVVSSLNWERQLFSLQATASSAEPGLGPLRQPHHHAGVHRGEEQTVCIRGKDPAPAESQQRPERRAEADAEKGIDRLSPIRSLTLVEGGRRGTEQWDGALTRRLVERTRLCHVVEGSCWGTLPLLPLFWPACSTASLMSVFFCCFFGFAKIIPPFFFFIAR